MRVRHLRCEVQTQILIRPWRIEDAAALQALANDHSVARWMTEAFPHPYLKQDAEDWVATASSHLPPRFFAIEVDGALVGGAGLEPREGSHRDVVILGYWLGRVYWGRGIATAAVNMLSELAFASGFRRIEALVFEPNVGSARVLEKCGFALEGRLQASYVERDGTPGDELVYGKLNLSPKGEMNEELFALDHVQLAIPAGKEPEARTFYVEVLGFQEIPKPEELARRGGAWLRSGTVNIHLGIDPTFAPATKAHPALRCFEYDAILEKISRHGISVTPDPLLFAGKEHCYIADPFGNRIELIREGGPR